MDLADAIAAGNYGDLSVVPIARLLDAQNALTAAIRRNLESVSSLMWPVAPPVINGDVWETPRPNSRGSVGP